MFWSKITKGGKWGRVWHGKINECQQYHGRRSTCMPPPPPPHNTYSFPIPLGNMHNFSRFCPKTHTYTHHNHNYQKKYLIWFPCRKAICCLLLVRSFSQSPEKVVDGSFTTLLHSLSIVDEKGIGEIASSNNYLGWTSEFVICFWKRNRHATNNFGNGANRIGKMSFYIIFGNYIL